MGVTTVFNRKTVLQLAQMTVPSLGGAPGLAPPPLWLGWVSTGNARANHSLLVGLVGGILKAPRRRGPEWLMESLGPWNRGHPGPQALWSTRGEGEQRYTHQISSKGDASWEPASLSLKWALGKAA